MTHKLFLGDCLSILKEIPDNSIDLILADPPYGTTACKWDIGIELEPLWGELKRIRKQKTASIFFSQMPFSIPLGNSNLEELRYEIIWHKTHPTGHLNAKRMPLKAHENLLVFYKKLPKYFPQKTSGHKRKHANKKKDRSEVYGEQNFKSLVYDSTDRYPVSVQTFSSDKQKSSFHPTQKPLKLMEWLIKTYSEENDLILDFCMGSGTTGLAAKILNRKFIGIEKDPEIFATAERRLRINDI